MDVHLTEVRDIANLLEEVDVNIPEDIIVYYTLKNLPKEYELFKRMQIAAQTLPTYEQLEAKLISEETSIGMENQQKEDGEAFLLHRNRTRRPQSAPRHSHFSTAPNSRHHRRYADSDLRHQDFRTKQIREDSPHRGPWVKPLTLDWHKGATRWWCINLDIDPEDLTSNGTANATSADWMGILRESATSYPFCIE